jgi:ERCC4-related helicase
VFYLTPQTLINDLEKGRVDAKDIVLLVIGRWFINPSNELTLT